MDARDDVVTSGGRLLGNVGTTVAAQKMMKGGKMQTCEVLSEMGVFEFVVVGSLEAGCSV